MLKYDLAIFLELLAEPLLLLALGLPRALTLGERRAHVLAFGAATLLAAALLELIVEQISFAVEPTSVRQEPALLAIWHVGLLASVVTGVAIWFVVAEPTRRLSGLIKPPGVFDVSMIAIALALTAIPYVPIYGGTTLASRGFFNPFFINELFSKTILIFGFTWAILLTTVETSPLARWPWRTIGFATILAAGPSILLPAYVRFGTMPEPLWRMTLYSLPIWLALSLLRAWSGWPWIVFVLPAAIAIFAWFWLRVVFTGL